MLILSRIITLESLNIITLSSLLSIEFELSGEPTDVIFSFFDISLAFSLFGLIVIFDTIRNTELSFAEIHLCQNLAGKLLCSEISDDQASKTITLGLQSKHVHYG